jgi:hypothetical protein
MMIPSLIAAALLGAAPAPAGETPAAPTGPETAIPRMSAYLDWIPDGERGLYIQADTGRWYYARLESACPRLDNHPQMRFDASPSNQFDRFSAIRTDGWRCQVASVVETQRPAGHR